MLGKCTSKHSRTTAPPPVATLLNVNHYQMLYINIWSKVLSKSCKTQTSAFSQPSSLAEPSKSSLHRSHHHHISHHHHPPPPYSQPEHCPLQIFLQAVLALIWHCPFCFERAGVEKPMEKSGTTYSLRTVHVSGITWKLDPCLSRSRCVHSS
eukprot:1142553-Pelagomonas_calceolata.AAC.9